MNTFDRAAQSIICDGYAAIKINKSFLNAIEDVFQAGSEFFQKENNYKTACSTPSSLEGYFGTGSEFSGKSYSPDMCESFCTWGMNVNNRNVDCWSKESDIHRLMNVVTSYYVKISRNILRSIKNKVNTNGSELNFSSSSCLQLNFYRPLETGRGFLQDEHEDGQLITILRSTGRGVEVYVAEKFIEPVLSYNEVLIMPGSILTAMTGGLVRPLVHRVRNFKEKDVRQSLMYFVNPNVGEAAIPWRTDRKNPTQDIRELTIQNSTKFGQISIMDMIEAAKK